jgi:hypothetical protein
MGFDHCSIASHTVTSSDGVGGARPNDRTGHSTASLDHVNPDEVRREFAIWLPLISTCEALPLVGAHVVE